MDTTTAGRLVGDADSRVGGVHGLAAGARGPEHVDLQVVFVDLDFDFGCFGKHRDGRRGRDDLTEFLVAPGDLRVIVRILGQVRVGELLLDVVELAFKFFMQLAHGVNLVSRARSRLTGSMVRRRLRSSQAADNGRRVTCWHQVQVDADREGHDHALIAVGESERWRDLVQPLAERNAFDRSERVDADRRWVIEHFGAKPTLAHQAIDRMRFGSSGSVLKHLRQNRTKRSVGRKIRVHHRKGALVIGANANVDPLLSAQAGDASDFDAPAFAGYDAVFDRDRNLGYVERGGDFRLEDRGWRAGSLRRNRGCQRGAIDGPHRWFRQEQLRPPSNDASFVVLYEQIDAGGIVAVRKNERLSERAIGRAVEQHRPCAIGIDRCTPRARRDRHLQGGRAAHGQVPATWRAGDRRVVQKRVPERLTLLPRQELQRLLQPEDNVAVLGMDVRLHGAHNRNGSGGNPGLVIRFGQLTNTAQKSRGGTSRNVGLPRCWSTSDQHLGSSKALSTMAEHQSLHFDLTAGFFDSSLGLFGVFLLGTFEHWLRQ
ncbi:hypothetical protein GQR58_030422 [Nymphon striatum]|nr:hypothetical protein GQR58_030422 [Nymphon striatum]